MRVKQRWYERNPVLLDAVNTWERAEENFQMAISSYVLYMDKHEMSHVPRYTLNPLSLTKKIHLLFLRQRKQRWYDSDKNTHKAFMALYSLPHGEQINLARHILKVNQYVRDMNIQTETMSLKEIEKMIFHVMDKQASSLQ